jgi:hypothetical protein
MLLGGNDLNLVETAEFLALYDIPQRQVTLREAVSVIVDATKLVLVVRTIEV